MRLIYPAYFRVVRREGNTCTSGKQNCFTNLITHPRSILPSWKLSMALTMGNVAIYELPSGEARMK